MSVESLKDILSAAALGDEKAFQQLHDRYHQRIRLVAWRITHRPDWLDDLLNEAWCRAYAQRTRFDPQRDFVVWMIGIVRNVYREYCRQGRLSLPGTTDLAEIDPESEDASPEALAHEAEVLEALNDCVERLSDADATIVRLRFFQNKTLREISQAVGVPEATIRASRLPEITESLRRCLSKKKIDVSDFFSAQAGSGSQ